MAELEKRVLKKLGFIVLLLAGCKLSGGLVACGYAAYGCFCAMQTGKVAKLATCFILLPLMLFFSPAICSGPLLGWGSRVGQIAMLFAMLLSPNLRRAKESVPLAVLYLYAAVALVSSMNGWFPLVSYLKLLNFLLFLTGIVCICKLMQVSHAVLEDVRCMIFSVAIFIIFGSIVAYFIPSVGYSMEIAKAQMYDSYLTTADVMGSEGLHLFSGVMNHSQTLATIVPLLAAWIICDMLVIERRITRLHAVCIAAAPILMYMSRSRTALVGFSVALTMIWFFCLPKAKMSAMTKKKVVSVFMSVVKLLIVALAVSQVRNQTLSRWLRKSENVQDDQRSLVEAITSTRQGLVDMNMRDFNMNPLFGMGFQVMEWHKPAYQAGRLSLLSAPIEKGVLPLMVLGETGVVGGFVFLMFIIVFYSKCFRRRYIVLATLFTVLLAVNMSEALFFSPGGGATEWTVCVIGGFALDMLVKSRARLEMQGGFYALVRR